MSQNQNQWEDDDFDFEDEEQEQPRSKPGNDLVKQLRKAEREKDKRLKELESELQSLRSERRESSISKVLESEGVNPKIAKFIPAEIQDIDAVKAWLNENSEVFGFNLKSQVQAQQNQDTYDADLASLRNMDYVTEDALSPNQLDDQYNQLNQAQSRDDILRMIMGQ